MDIRVVEITGTAEAVRAITQVGADPYAVGLMAKKAFMRVLLLHGVDNRAANLLKQEALSLGGEAAVSKDISCFKRGASDVLLALTRRQYDRLLAKIAQQPFGLKAWAAKIGKALSHYETKTFDVPCGDATLRLGGRPLVMGILNATPDSFSDGGRYFDADAAVERGLALAEAGADIIDIGGESTRPGAGFVPAKEEIARILPVIKKLSAKLDLPISVDTYKPEVARAALAAGAGIINDITGLRYEDGAMLAVARKNPKAAIVLMHMQGTPRTMQKEPKYRDVVGDINDFFERQLAIAAEAGIAPERIILDPGIGFGKTVEHNLALLRRLREFAALGRPLLVGASRKKFVGLLTGEDVPDRRLAGSLAAHLHAAANGAHILRVHDVKETAEALTIFSAIEGGQK